MLESLMWGTNLSLLWESFCSCNYSLFVNHLPGSMGVDYIMTRALLLLSLWFLLYIFNNRRYFLVNSGLFY